MSEFEAEELLEGDGGATGDRLPMDSAEPSDVRGATVGKSALSEAKLSRWRAEGLRGPDCCAYALAWVMVLLDGVRERAAGLPGPVTISEQNEFPNNEQHTGCRRVSLGRRAVLLAYR